MTHQSGSPFYQIVLVIVIVSNLHVELVVFLRPFFQISEAIEGSKKKIKDNFRKFSILVCNQIFLHFFPCEYNFYLCFHFIPNNEKSIIFSTSQCNSKTVFIFIKTQNSPAITIEKFSSTLKFVFKEYSKTFSDGFFDKSEKRGTN